MRAVVIGTDEDGDVLACGALHQRAAHRRPGGEQALGVGRQRGPDLVPRAGQVPQQDLLVVEPAPAVEVALLPGLEIGRASCRERVAMSMGGEAGKTETWQKVGSHRTSPRARPT